LRCVLDSEVLRRLDPVLVGNRDGLLQSAISMGLDGLPGPVVDPGGDYVSEKSRIGQICKDAGRFERQAHRRRDSRPTLPGW